MIERARQRAPRTLTAEEQKRVLSPMIMGTNEGTVDLWYRDHMVVSIALGTALREHEIAALSIGDVYRADRGVRDRIRLRTFKGKSRESSPNVQEVFVPEKLRTKLSKFISWKKRMLEPTRSDSPLFTTSRGTPISTRTLRHNWRKMQRRAGFSDPLFTFHALRHTAIQNVYEQAGDLRLTQRFARHADIHTTTIYAAPSDDRVRSAIDNLPC